MWLGQDTKIFPQIISARSTENNKKCTIIVRDVAKTGIAISAVSYKSESGKRYAMCACLLSTIRESVVRRSFRLSRRSIKGMAEKI